MALHGKNFIGSELSAAGQKTFFGFDPRAGKQLDTPFYQGTSEEVDRALSLASDAFPVLREASAETIAGFLENIASEIEALGDELIQQASIEAGLGAPRLNGERGRTTGQLRMFANLVKEGSFVDARIDPALPDRKPLARPDIRRMLIPTGPVVVFGASNFPLAFSVAGGDTASALAAKCPVIVKGHPAHPGTSELVAGAITRAVKKSGLPEGTFSLIHGVDPAVSIALVTHPGTKAVAFTGSEHAGRAIFDAAMQRPEPIPAYVEMGSVNPVFILPGALKERSDAIAQGLVSSINLGVGQFCTCPGLIFGVEDETYQGFRQKLAEEFSKSTPATMVHPNVLKGYDKGLQRVKEVSGVEAKPASQPANVGKTEAAPVLFETDATTWLKNETLAQEVFGPSAIVVRGNSEDQLVKAAQTLPGTLTATVHGTADDLKKYRKLIAVLENKAGRLVFNGFPTGVEVSSAMHHGGPYPATADAKYTSVGTAAILRFVRPICYQSFPDDSLPLELKDANPKNLWRMVDGSLTRDAVKRG
jgi:alpha-ketoglutaric semialdehyde dehydrogenase